MKKIYIAFVLAFIATSCQQDISAPAKDSQMETRASGSDGQAYYWYHGKKIPLTTDFSSVNVVMKEGSSGSDALFEKVGFEVDNDRKIAGMVKLKFRSGKASAAEYSQAVAALKQSEQVAYVLPYYERGGGAEPIGTSDIFYLKLKKEEDIAMLEKTATGLGVEVLREFAYTPRWYVLSILGSEFGNSTEASNYFYETGEFESVDPAFMFDFRPNSAAASEPAFGEQWGLKNTGQNGGTAGIDINVIPAWEITAGEGIKVAVVDTPIEFNHSDLDENIHSLSLNAISGQSPSGPVVLGVPLENHGTHIAGIIAAESNGSQVVGVAHESKIIGVSHDLDAYRTDYSAQMANGINWAWQHGKADVISCSWGDQGGLYYNEVYSDVLDEAIDNAIKSGRRSDSGSSVKGTVVVFASGNFGRNMDYPGNFHDGILTVGAIDRSGTRATFYNGTSAYGLKLDVVAPGKDILSTVPGGGTELNSGTSMAAPHVAGVAALVLAVNPDFTREQVVNIIESTARKVRTDLYDYYDYPGRPNGSWNEQMGYGLVDAGAAVAMANALVGFNPSIVGSDTVMVNGSARYDISIPTALFPAGISFNGWMINGGNHSSTGGVYDPFRDITFNAPGTYTLIANFNVYGSPFSISKRVTVTSLPVIPEISISGSSSATVGTNVTYSVPATHSTSGATFQNWTQITGATMSNRYSPTLNIIFNSAGNHTLTANFKMPAPDNRTFSSTTRNVIVSNTPPIVYPDWSGPTDVEVYNQVQYGIISATMSMNTQFTGWEILQADQTTPFYYSINNATSYYPLINFNAVGAFCLKANFIINGNVPYVVQKTIRSHVPIEQFYPQVELQNQGGGRVMASITNFSDHYLSNSDSYVEWNVNGRITSLLSYYPIYFDMPQPGGSVTVRCRLVSGSKASQQGSAFIY